jgi:UDP-N-acetylmuramoylalanine--D-glutamate ligase
MNQVLMNYSGKQILVLGLGESGFAMARWLVRCGAVVRVADTRDAPERLPQLRAILPEADFIGGPFAPALLDDIDFVAVGPGLAPNLELAQILPAAAEREIPVWGEIELFAQALRALRTERAYVPKVIAITGTNGKTTVTSLTGLLCSRAGLRVQVAGNISPAALDVLREMLDHDTLPQVWVLELSSFQLHATFSLQADAATVLNVTQDHLDWHGAMDAYTADKARIFGAQTVRVLNRDDARVMRMAAPPPPVLSAKAKALAKADADALAAADHDADGNSLNNINNPSLAAEAPATITFGADEPNEADCFGLLNERGMQWLVVAVAAEEGEKRRRKKGMIEAAVPVILNRLMPADALQIRGQHNAVNALAALALCRAIGLPFAPLLHGLRDYQGEPHRVELVQTIGAVDYYDDSKGTNVGATAAALKGLGASQNGNSQRLILIAGGDGKGQDFGPLAEPVSRYARAVLLIGRDAGRLRAALEESGVDLIDCASMDDAVARAAGLAQAGDAVLMSPACASFDMFNNYLHRAEVFVAAVREIALQRGEVMA